VVSKKKRKLLPFIPSDDPAQRLRQMASLATALTATGAVFSNHLTYQPGMAPRSANRAALEAALPASSPCTLFPSEGGWSAIVRVPATRSDEAWAAELLARDGVLVHPGYFFDVRGGTYLVVSLLPRPDEFRDGAHRLAARCADPR